VSVARRINKVVHDLDHAIGRFSSARRVLVEMRTPVYQAVLGPVCSMLQDAPGIDLSYTSEYPDRIAPLVGPGQFLTHSEAEWTRFDLYLNADPWAAARLRRCARRINFFHGVAGKYDLDRPHGLPMGFEYYDRVAFINRDRMLRYLDAGVVTESQAVLVGFPKLDRLASGQVTGPAIRDGLGLNAARPTALYAPTYSQASSLHLAGEHIIRELAGAGFNVIVKLHDRSLDPDLRYTAGIDWRQRMTALEQPGTIRYVEGPDASPYLAAADVMVTDHSSVGFEYLVLDRPLIVFDAPGLVDAARINPEKVALLQSAATVVRGVDTLAAAARAGLAQPDRLSNERRRVAGEMFHEPGKATARAVSVIRDLLAAPVRRTHPVQTPVDAQPAGRGVS
jgi:CDP-glycerol:poly(glycerophosphate) glycerophosphotransferase